jgi:hypothetical protein
MNTENRMEVLRTYKFTNVMLRMTVIDNDDGDDDDDGGDDNVHRMCMITYFLRLRTWLI